MQNIFNTLQADIKEAMVSKNNTKRDCLRTIVAEIKNQTINANPVKDITDEICLKVLQKSAKTHADSISQFKSAGRTELLEKEEQELVYIESYLPKMFDENATKECIDRMLADNDIAPIKQNMGKIMKMLGAITQIDKKIASKYLNTILK